MQRGTSKTHQPPNYYFLPSEVSAPTSNSWYAPRHGDAFVITRDIILERMLAVAHIDFEFIEANA
jgi:hypothetical protein